MCAPNHGRTRQKIASATPRYDEIMRNVAAADVAQSCVLRIRRLALTAGIAPADLPSGLASIASGEALTPATRVSALAHQRSWRWLARHIEAGMAPLRAALVHPEFEAHDLLSQVCMTTRTLAQATATSNRYWALRDATCAWTQRIEPRTVHLVLRSAGPISVEQAMAMTSHVIDAIVSARAMTGQLGLAPLRIDLPIDKPRAHRAYADFFGCPVRFAAPRCEIVSARAQHELPLLAPISMDSAPMLEQRADRCLHGLAPPPDAPQMLRTKLRWLLADRLDEEPALADCARVLGVSARTLQRRLQQSDSSFQDVLDAARIEQARYLLLDESLSIEEIASRVGFHEAGALHRIFRRLCGSTPSAFRKRE